MPEKYDIYGDPIGISFSQAQVYYDPSLTEPAMVSAPLPAKFHGSQAAAKRYAEGYRWGQENVVAPRERELQNVFSLLYGVGTAGDDESDFTGVKTMLYNPNSYGIYALDNAYDERGKGTSKFSYFFPSYISRAGCMDKDGNSDVVKALFQILMQRYDVKHGGDPASLLSRIA